MKTTVTNLLLCMLAVSTCLAGKIQYIYDAAGRLAAEDYGGGTQVLNRSTEHSLSSIGWRRGSGRGGAWL